MKQVLALTVFMLVVSFAIAQQQPDPAQQPSGGQTTSPSSPQTPSPSSPQTTSPNPPQTGAEPGAQSQPQNLQITEGCLAGSNPNFTITDKAGTTYKLNFSPNQNPSVLTAHVGESVQVAGQVSDAAGGAGKGSSIDVQKIGKGTGSCPAGKSKSPSP